MSFIPPTPSCRRAHTACKPVGCAVKHGKREEADSTWKAPYDGLGCHLVADGKNDNSDLFTF